MTNVRNLMQSNDGSMEKLPRDVVVLGEGHDSIPFDSISCRDLAFIAQSWIDMPRLPGEPLPRWSEFRLSAFVKVINKLCVVLAREGDADRMEITVCGQHATEYVGNGKPIDLAHMRNDPLRCANYADIRDRVARAIANNAPQYALKTLSWQDMGYVEYEVMVLPFMSESGAQRILHPISVQISN